MNNVDISITKQVLKAVLLTPLNEPMELQVRKGTGQALIQRVRVELSRVRAKVLAAGSKIIQFKVRAHIVHMINDPDADYEFIIFRRTAANSEIPVNFTELENIMLAAQQEAEDDKRERAI